MSNPRLPEELLDHIVDLLYDTRRALQSCSLVSKSWIHRTRKYLFANVAFHTAANLESWRKSFPDPATSPACYAETLAIDCPQAVTAADAEEGGLIPTFSRVVLFELDIYGTNLTNLRRATQLKLFHGFSPVLKTFRMTFTGFPPTPIPDLIFSFPLLEDVSLKAYGGPGENPFNVPSVIAQPSSPPAFTGSLELSLMYGIHPIASRLLSLPNNLRFRELSLTWQIPTDPLLTIALMESCRSTLESLRMHCEIVGELPQNPIDLSRAARLEDVTFVWNLNPRWVIASLRTIKSDHRNSPMQITVDASYVLYHFDRFHFDTARFMDLVGVAACAQWLELDRLLANLQESRLIRPKVLYNVPSSMVTEDARSYIECLLPEMMRRGVVDY